MRRRQVGSGTSPANAGGPASSGAAAPDAGAPVAPDVVPETGPRVPEGGADAGPGAVGDAGTDVPDGGSQSTPDAGGDGAHASGAGGSGTPDTWPLADGDPIVDSAGTDLTGVIDSSALSRVELDDFLQTNFPEAHADVLETGVWPADVQIPAGPHVLDAAGRIDWAQVPHEGFELRAGEPISEVAPPNVGEVVDRYGPPGRFTSPTPESGPYSYPERAVPYVEDPAQFHRFEVERPFEDIESIVANHPDARLRADVQNIVDRYCRGDWDRVVVQRGPIAEGFGQPGGGVQYRFPIATDLLERLGILREI